MDLGDFDFNLIKESYLSKEEINKVIAEYDLPIRFINNIRNKNFTSEKNLIKFIEAYLMEHSSNYLFPNQFVNFYPCIKELIANKNKTCHLSGSFIKKGEYYLKYHPFLENLDTGKIYVTRKDIIAADCYLDYLPKTLASYEEWCYKIKLSCYGEDNPIDFYNLSVECGENCLEPYSLGLKRKR